jgi:hypothetical protein
MRGTVGDLVIDRGFGFITGEAIPAIDNEVLPPQKTR